MICCDNERRGCASEEDLIEVERDARRAIAESDPQSSIILPTPSLRWDGLLDRLWRATFSERTGFKSARALARKALTLAKFFTGDYSQNWQPVARRAAQVIGESLKIDACIGEHSPDAGLFLAGWFSKKYDVPWAADFRDPILQPFKPFVRQIYRPLARRLLRSASGAINVNRVWADMDRELFQCPTWTIPNGFDPEEFFASTDDSVNPYFTIAYMGRIDRAQRLETFLEGLTIARRSLDAELFSRIRFQYRGVSHEHVLDLSAQFQLTDVCDVEARISREQSLRFLVKADLLLLLSADQSLSADEFYSHGFHPAKAFEYFGAGRPIICVPGDGGLLDDLIRETETGVVLRSADEVARCIIRCASIHRQGEPIAYNPNEEAVSFYTRRNLAERFARALEQIAEVRSEAISHEQAVANSRGC
ncbi:MAG: hypothetical protein AB1631_32210 [Acidobacteriota bacterium]